MTPAGDQVLRESKRQVEAHHEGSVSHIEAPGRGPYCNLRLLQTFPALLIGMTLLGSAMAIALRRVA